MDWALPIIGWIKDHWQDVIVALDGLLAAVILLCMLIPGEQPEKFLQGILDQLRKWSRKP